MSQVAMEPSAIVDTSTEWVKPLAVIAHEDDDRLLEVDTGEDVVDAPIHVANTGVVFGDHVPRLVFR